MRQLRKQIQNLIETTESKTSYKQNKLQSLLSKTTKTVVLVYQECYCCGCKDVALIKREIPGDSNLNDGDIITELFDTDIFITFINN